ncbi:MAG: hypothetical protein F4X56_08690 [Gammaproteobacteria bacterium]|nr:hypothetical protein [Gammaproteobacteria bacterium]MYC25976.1 hypothetical protein [Gammaproteobacteria bacterium]
MNSKNNLRSIRLEISAGVLQSVFDECDRYDHHETGGRLVGHYELKNDTLVVQANGLLPAGPKAKRSQTSFFQDGEFQTRMFRQLEEQDPTIEHLGNWHTHHVNGYPTLSGGDIATYQRIVNHEFHNLNFFYALLVTRKLKGRTGLDRYVVRHFLLFRDDENVYEVEPRDVHITKGYVASLSSVALTEEEATSETAQHNEPKGSIAVRALDQAILKVLYPSLKPRLSKRTGTFFWKGNVVLIDGSVAAVKAIEVESEDELVYYPVVSNVSNEITKLCESPYKSAVEAVRALEVSMNKELYTSATQNRFWNIWKR